MVAFDTNNIVDWIKKSKFDKIKKWKFKLFRELFDLLTFNLKQLLKIGVSRKKRFIKIQNFKCVIESLEKRLKLIKVNMQHAQSCFFSVKNVL